MWKVVPLNLPQKFTEFDHIPVTDKFSYLNVGFDPSSDTLRKMYDIELVSFDENSNIRNAIFGFVPRFIVNTSDGDYFFGYGDNYTDRIIKYGAIDSTPVYSSASVPAGSFRDATTYFLKNPDANGNKYLIYIIDSEANISTFSINNFDNNQVHVLNANVNTIHSGERGKQIEYDVKSDRLWYATDKHINYIDQNNNGAVGDALVLPESMDFRYFRLYRNWLVILARHKVSEDRYSILFWNKTIGNNLYDKIINLEKSLVVTSMFVLQGRLYILAYDKNISYNDASKRAYAIYQYDGSSFVRISDYLITNAGEYIPFGNVFANRLYFPLLRIDSACLINEHEYSNNLGLWYFDTSVGFRHLFDLRLQDKLKAPRDISVLSSTADELYFNITYTKCDNPKYPVYFYRIPSNNKTFNNIAIYETALIPIEYVARLNRVLLKYKKYTDVNFKIYVRFDKNQSYQLLYSSEQANPSKRQGDDYLILSNFKHREFTTIQFKIEVNLGIIDIYRLAFDYDIIEKR